MRDVGMDTPSVHAVLDALAAAGCPCWISGGWGVDALVGRRTRPHRDLDLAIDAAREADAMEALAALGYTVETDWRPIRVELVEPGEGRVDLHPVRFQGDGGGRQAGLDGAWFGYPRGELTTGTIGGRTVPCISAHLQLTFHRGYEPRDVDVMDLRRLYELIADGPLTPERLIAAAGRPVLSGTLTPQEVHRAAAEGRVFGVHVWSTMGDHEAWFAYAVRVTGSHAGYLVFPRPVPLTMRHGGAAGWEETDEVYAAFGL
jgi:lincosamide nucleotidyltransferase A/C/D/E